MYPVRILAAAAALLLIPGPAIAAEAIDPLRFFEGTTETSGTIKVMLRKPIKTRSLGKGRIESDGSLTLVQQVEEDGKPKRERRWRIRQVAPKRFSGTMTDASGPVTIEEVGGRYRFRFRMKGNVAVEQWVSPLPGAKSATNKMTFRKLGVVVGHGDGMIRKLGR